MVVTWWIVFFCPVIEGSCLWDLAIHSCRMIDIRNNAELLHFTPCLETVVYSVLYFCDTNTDTSRCHVYCLSMNELIVCRHTIGCVSSM